MKTILKTRRDRIISPPTAIPATAPTDMLAFACCEGGRALEAFEEGDAMLEEDSWDVRGASGWEEVGVGGWLTGPTAGSPVASTIISSWLDIGLKFEYVFSVIHPGVTYV
jgi:hypothetical protein